MKKTRNTFLEALFVSLLLNVLLGALVTFAARLPGEERLSSIAQI